MDLLPRSALPTYCFDARTVLTGTNLVGSTMRCRSKVAGMMNLPSSGGRKDACRQRDEREVAGRLTDRQGGAGVAREAHKLPG